MQQYPLVLIPDRIKDAQSAIPPLPSPPSPPIKPGAKPEKINLSLIAIESALSVPVSAILGQITQIPAWFLLLVAVGAIAYQTWVEVKTYPQRKEKHDREVALYPQKVRNYELKKQQHEEEIKAARTPEKLAAFRQKLLLDVLSRTTPQDGNGSMARTGRSEASFESYLKKYFSGKIYTDLKVQNPKYEIGYHYTPDFAYIDEILNLYIDIEIDEPYNSKGEPIHYVESNKQYTRDEHFNSRGWVVIRFCEEQVMRWPSSCCKVVAATIAQVTGDKTILQKFANTPELEPINRWTETEAQQMAARKYRDRY